MRGRKKQRKERNRSDPVSTAALLFALAPKGGGGWGWVCVCVHVRAFAEFVMFV